jgi:hypothetical protein
VCSIHPLSPHNPQAANFGSPFRNGESEKAGCGGIVEKCEEIEESRGDIQSRIQDPGNDRR